MRYIIQSHKPHTHFIDIELIIDKPEGLITDVKLPVWRPGRYELGNFAKNVKHFTALDDSGNPLKILKTDKSTWQIEHGITQRLIINYSYYANQPDAGGCFCNNDFLYANPVHCCLYVEQKMKKEHVVELKIPYTWQVATSMKQEMHHVYRCASFDELADSPFIASGTLMHLYYSTVGVNFNIWIQGDYQPDAEKVVGDFEKFTALQLQVMKSIPCTDYHFILLALPFKFYHGVEHLSSTVLALGPADSIAGKELYDELIGVASHELFHVWNVKTIRPVEMMPYNFAAENYSRLGYVYEGVTTYYGDLFLKRCNYFSDEAYFREIETRLCKHIMNEGRFNQSVAESSFDTWLDGYVPGIPGRKVSIYDEGSLIALMLDLIIINQSACTRSLDDVMRLLYNDFGKRQRGYTSADFKQACEAIAGMSLDDFFRETVNAANDYTAWITRILDLAGCQLVIQNAPYMHQQFFGFMLSRNGSKILIERIVTGSPADVAGLALGDELIKIADEAVEYSSDTAHNIDYLLEKHENETVACKVISFGKVKEVYLSSGNSTYFNSYKIQKITGPSELQQNVFNYWTGRRC